MDLVFATHNLNKLQEVQPLLPEHINLLSLEDIGCTKEIKETAATLEGNALLKVKYVTEHYGYACFADDTGLLVDALDGAPGVYSARYAGNQKNAGDNINKLLAQLRHRTDRSAQFKTIIALHLNNENHLFDGIVQGEITTKRIGKQGFGYDPVFMPKGYNQTFGQLSMAVKNNISHRARALEKLTAYLNNPENRKS
jgi:XTP/dITP diphosphohydrolase